VVGVPRLPGRRTDRRPGVGARPDEPDNRAGAAVPGEGAVPGAHVGPGAEGVLGAGVVPGAAVVSGTGAVPGAHAGPPPLRAARVAG
jgi:hypothetical protein